MRNRFLIPIGKDSDKYFDILKNFKDYIGGVYIGWPGAPSGRVDASPSEDFFYKIFSWCRKNNKIFDILFNMQVHDFPRGFRADKIDLSRYQSKITQLTFSSLHLYREKAFKKYRKTISVNYKINSIRQLYFLLNELPDIKSFILDRDINRNREYANKINQYAKNKRVQMDILVNEGCLPYCPNKIDHNIFITLSKYSNQKENLAKTKEICVKAFKNRTNILKSPFLSRETLQYYECRFFKIVGRKKQPELIANILDYYINGKPVDIGIAFTNMSVETGIRSDRLPAGFHRKILSCRNDCFNCDYCESVGKKLEKIQAG